MGDTGSAGRESRRAERAKVYYMAQIAAHGELERVKLLDVSALGARIESQVALFALDEVVLIREGLQIPCRVVWSEGNRAGLEFIGFVEPDDIAKKLAPPRIGR
jgi:PilZ domain